MVMWIWKDLEEELEKTDKRCLVSLMHANNEIGNLLDIEAVGNLCKQYNAIFHSDCVQTVGHYHLDLRKTAVHFISGSGHKFHGPKGIGILYINDNIKIKTIYLRWWPGKKYAGRYRKYLWHCWFC